jgi:hypothetical protein
MELVSFDNEEGAVDRQRWYRALHRRNECSKIPQHQQSYQQNKQTRSDSSSDLILQYHSHMRFSSGCGAPSGQYVGATHACCWLWSCMPSTQRSFAVVYQPRHYPTNEMHITR